MERRRKRLLCKRDYLAALQEAGRIAEREPKEQEHIAEQEKAEVRPDCVFCCVA